MGPGVSSDEGHDQGDSDAPGCCLGGARGTVSPRKLGDGAAAEPGAAASSGSSIGAPKVGSSQAERRARESARPGTGQGGATAGKTGGGARWKQRGVARAASEPVCQPAGGNEAGLSGLTKSGLAKPAAESLSGSPEPRFAVSRHRTPYVSWA